MSIAAREGTQAALKKVGLEDYLNQSAEVVLSALCDILSPAGTTRDDVATRQAMATVLGELYEELDEEGLEFSSLDSLNEERLTGIIRSFVAESIFRRWINDLGRCIERNAISEGEAVRLEREIRDWIHETVKLDLSGTNMLQADWQSREMNNTMDRIYKEAYGFIEDTEE